MSGSEKTNLIYTKYICSCYGFYFFLCVNYLKSSLIEFLRNFCIDDKICVKILCQEKELFN